MIKSHLQKLSQETCLPWLSLLPFALVRIRNTARSQGLGSFEKLHGRPFLRNDLLDREMAELMKYVSNLTVFQQQLSNLKNSPDREKENENSLYHQGDIILVKSLPSNSPSLEPIWEGPCTVNLSSSTAVEVAAQSWIGFTTQEPKPGTWRKKMPHPQLPRKTPLNTNATLWRKSRNPSNKQGNNQNETSGQCNCFSLLCHGGFFHFLTVGTGKCFVSWAHSYAYFQNQSDCCVCRALPMSFVEGFHIGKQLLASM